MSGTLVNHAEAALYPPKKSYAVALEEYPVTLERLPYVPSANDALVDPGTARANIAPTREKPNGTTERNWAKDHQHQTASARLASLQPVVVQHVDYFDHDHDGVIWPSDTYVGLRAFGWSVPLCLYATFLINGFLSYPTLPTFLPDPFFRIYTQRMHKAKHGSDSMSYDNEGRFRPQNFEDFFAKYDKDGKGGMTARELWGAWRGQMLVGDVFGCGAAFLEWLATYLLIWPEDGVLRKEDVRGVFDGSVFYKKAEQHRQKVLSKEKRKRLDVKVEDWAPRNDLA